MYSGGWRACCTERFRCALREVSVQNGQSEIQAPDVAVELASRATVWVEMTIAERLELLAAGMDDYQRWLSHRRQGPTKRRRAKKQRMQ